MQKKISLLRKKLFSARQWSGQEQTDRRLGDSVGPCPVVSQIETRPLKHSARNVSETLCPIGDCSEILLALSFCDLLRTLRES